MPDNPNPASKTVHGLSVAITVLSAIGLIGVLLLAAVTIGGVAVYNSNEVQSELANATWDDVLGSASVEMSDKELEELAQAVGSLESLDNDQVEPLVQLLKGLGEGDASALHTLFAEHDTSEVSALVTAVASLSDSDIEKLSNDVSGVSAADLQDLRDAAKNVTPEDIATLQTLVSETTPQDAANSIMGMVAGLGAGVIGLGLIAVVLSLVAGILGMRNAYEPQRLGAAFVVNIIAAILSLLTGRIITLILHIIACVYISKVRNAQAYTYAR